MATIINRYQGVNPGVDLEYVDGTWFLPDMPEFFIPQPQQSQQDDSVDRSVANQNDRFSGIL